MVTKFQRTPCPKYSPWGNIQTRDELAPGIWWVTTPGHGGALISPERLEAMPEEFKAARWDPQSCPYAFEEDCSWCAVYLAFEDEFPSDQVAVAREVWKRVYAAKDC